DANTLYVQTAHHVADSHTETPPEQTPQAVLFGVLNHVGVETSATEQLRAELHTEESLATLVARYNYAARLGAPDRHRALLTNHAPTVLDAAAEPALLQILRNAEDLGWNAEHVLRDALAPGSLTDADDPAALLGWRIQQRITTRNPPTTPRVEDTTRYIEVLTRHAPDALDHPARPALLDALRTAEQRGWQAEDLVPHITRRSLAGAEDPAAVLHWRIHQRIDRGPPPRTPPADRATEPVAAGPMVQQRALPWQAYPHHTLTENDPEIARYLAELNTAIDTRHTELRTQLAHEQPTWTARLGPRPESATAAARWDRLAGLAAAYRETHRETTRDPAHPLGATPDSHGITARSFTQITQQWRPIMTTPDDQHHDRTHERIDALRDLRERHDHRAEDTHQRRATR
ncbi:MAG: hypothetical protein ACREOZ_01240, partial [Gloeomargaritales cyanobacterium]